MARPTTRLTGHALKELTGKSVRINGAGGNKLYILEGASWTCECRMFAHGVQWTKQEARDAHRAHKASVLASLGRTGEKE